MAASSKRKRDDGVIEAIFSRSSSKATRPHGAVEPQGQKGHYETITQGGAQSSTFSGRSELPRTLPIRNYQTHIISAVRESDVLVLTGETGSGKSTQVPQFLLNEACIRPKKTKHGYIGGCIAITQPRRVAAISLAHRVASELKEPLGFKVGYSVRFDTKISQNTRIKFLTDGMLLQELLLDPLLKNYSAVIVDEIHERGVNVDLVVGFLKRLLVPCEARGQIPLKIIAMSATADVESLEDFFAQSISESIDSNFKVSKLAIEGRQYPVQTLYTDRPVADFKDAAFHTVCKIHCGEPFPGDILCFVTGRDDVESLEQQVKSFSETLSLDIPKISIVPLFAALSNAEQDNVFQPAPRKTRKIVIATNIAETSITVPGIRYVVDCGKGKVKQYRAALGLDSLLAKPISKSSAIQRKGRAGREAPGKCYRLYTEADYAKLKDVNKPEISRVNLAEPILIIKTRGVDDLSSFPFLTSPSREALESSLVQLHQLGALDDSGEVSQTGREMSKLPLPPTLARVLIESTKSDMNCLSEVIDVVSCLSVDHSIFLPLISEERREEAQETRQQLLRREGDHITLLNVMRQYLRETSDRRDWAKKHFLSYQTLKTVQDIRKQLREYCRRHELLRDEVEASDDDSAWLAKTDDVLRCFLEAFALQTARITPDGSYKTFVGQHNIAIHPNSSMFGRKTEAIMYHAHVFTSKAYATNVSSIPIAWIDAWVRKRTSKLT